MASATNTSKPFHTYENVCYDDQQQQQQQQHIANNISGYATATTLPSSPSSLVCSQVATAAVPSSTLTSNGLAQTALASTGSGAASGGGTIGTTTTTTTAIAINKAAIESPFPDPLLAAGGGGGGASSVVCDASTLAAKILATSTDSVGVTTRMLSSSSALSASSSSSSPATARCTSKTTTAGGQNLVTRLVTFPPQSPMDSLKEWSLSTLKCTKQLINERRGLCPVTSDSQLANDIEQLRENRSKLVAMLRLGQQMISHYGQLVRTQKQLYSLVNEMSVRFFMGSKTPTGGGGGDLSPLSSSLSASYKAKASKQVVANFSSLGNNLSSSTTTSQSPTRKKYNNNLNHQHQHHHLNNHPPHYSQYSASANSSIQHFEDYLPVLNHMKTFNDTNLVDDFKKNAITLNVAIGNGEKLIAALNFYCSNLSTLINKTIEDTLTTVKLYELARLEYDAEKNSLNFMSAASSSSSSQTAATYSSDKVELARMRYEQLREDVQIKMRFLEENTIKVMHKQLLLFNGAFASYTAGNTAALDSTLKQFSIKD